MSDSIPQPLRLAALLSGGGRTLLNLLDRIEDGSLSASIEIVIASRPCTGVDRVQSRGLPVSILAKSDFPDVDALHDAITRSIVEANIDLTLLCGYLRWIRVDPPLAGRVINIHPALLPEFGGPGMYGQRVHRAVLAAGKRESGCTVHQVDDQYDHGPVILQRTCPVLSDDDEHTLAERVFAEECLAYPEAIRKFMNAYDPIRNSLDPLSP